MSSIKIVAVPPGLAPQKIREEWVGIQIPLAATDMLRRAHVAVKIDNQNEGGYIVLRIMAVEALRLADKNEAANYWDALPFVRFLQFKQEVCELVA